MAPTALRLAVVGAGQVAPWQLAAWREVPGVEVVALCDHNRERASALASRFGIAAVYGDVGTMLEGVVPDAVDVLTSPEAHRAVVLRSAEGGRPVLCQKPLAPTWAEARAIVDGCRARGARLMVNENFRWRASFRWIKGRLETGALGRIFFASFTSRYHAADTFVARWPAFGRRRRLLLLESTVHLIDVARFLFGEPISVYCQTQRASEAGRGEDTASLVLAFEGLTVVLLHGWASHGYPPFPMTEAAVALEGTAGSIFVDGDGRARLVRADGSVDVSDYSTDFAGYYRASFVDAQRHFVACLASGAPFETSGEDNLRTLAATFAAYASAAGNRVRRLRPAP